MRIGLFIPCFIDAFFPEVGIATLELLERFGHEVVYPRDQTCCGQPMADNGTERILAIARSSGGSRSRTGANHDFETRHADSDGHRRDGHGSNDRARRLIRQPG
jgi:hypothetical protein